MWRQGLKEVKLLKFRPWDMVQLIQRQVHSQGDAGSILGQYESIEERSILFFLLSNILIPLVSSFFPSLADP